VLSAPETEPARSNTPPVNDVAPVLLSTKACVTPVLAGAVVFVTLMSIKAAVVPPVPVNVTVFVLAVVELQSLRKIKLPATAGIALKVNAACALAVLLHSR
jgi:hypothetical protein